MFWEGFEDMFCPKCKVLMYPKEGVFVCIKCGFEKKKTGSNVVVCTKCGHKWRED